MCCKIAQRVNTPAPYFYGFCISRASTLAGAYVTKALLSRRSAIQCEPARTMKNLITSFTMNTILATSLSAQGPMPMTPTTNWLAAHQQSLGTNAPANWLLDLDTDAMEVYITPEHALVLVDRAPIMEKDGVAYLRNGLNGLGGTRLSLVGEVEPISDTVLHGTYSGLLGGTAVLMDQYVQLRNGIPVALVRTITRVNGSMPAFAALPEEQIVALLERPNQSSEPALTKN